ncbi:endogenous retrovirus group K member 10 Gag polyprotein-like [Suncus etruscus]|uniref:endogenous retrovirus group K member 10 Gag polyprotein-like n=1 Tax=Suncus etruscus TaxID=109475 RepID=UPI00211027B1|nr:endogenous retrovirus group K member 10 Gag polyprotein-like [Suncus etruscus]
MAGFLPALPPPPYSADRLPNLPQVLARQTVPSNFKKCKADLKTQLRELKEIKSLEEQIVRLQASYDSYQFPVFFNQQPKRVTLPTPSLPPPIPRLPEDRGRSHQRGTGAVTRSHSLDRAQAGQRAQALARSLEDIQEEPQQVPDNPESAPLVGNHMAEIRRYQRLQHKPIETLFQAINTYGHNAPYTLSCLEAVRDGGELLPAEWKEIASTTLPRSDYILWETDFLARCRQQANLGNGGFTLPDQIYEQLTGTGTFASFTVQQQRLSPARLAQINTAALRAWRAMPKSGQATIPLAQTVQGPQEPYNKFISRLLETVERIMGSADYNNPLVKQLAYENANETCKAILRGQNKLKPLNEMIRLCSEADPFVHKIGQAIVAFQNQSNGKTCFKCGQPGHWVKTCPMAKHSPVLTTANTEPKPSLCPQCRRGKHWVASCHSKTDIEGNPLPPHQGNGRRARPQGPQKSILMGLQRPAHPVQQFVAPAQSNPNLQQDLIELTPQQPPLSEPPQAPQEWTCVRPPQQY